MQLQDFERPEENVRSIPVGKNKLFLKRTDPYGFVSISFERGELPAELKGQFTSFDEAVQKVAVYINKKKTDSDSA